MLFHKKYDTRIVASFFCCTFTFFLVTLSIVEGFSQVLGAYNCTGAVQNYVVPSGICQVQLKAWGAGGGGGGVDGGFGGGAGGGGSYADVTINVVAGDVLSVYVGCRGLQGIGCTSNPGGGGGFGYGAGGNGGNAGPVPCSGPGGGGGGSSGVLLNGTPVIVAAGGGGGGGAGCNSAGGAGGAGSMGGSSTVCGAVGGNASSSGSQNGAVGISHTADGGGGGGGGGGYVNGGAGGGVPPVGPSCGPGDCGAAGAGGGDSYAPAGTITNGSGTTPGNNTDPDLCAGCAAGGASQSNGTDGFVEILGVVAPVTATASGNSPLCTGFTLNLNSSGGGTYAWAGPNGFNSPSQNPSIPNATPAVSGIYTVTVTNATGCTDTAMVNVVVNPLPAANAGADQTLCAGNSAQLNASGGTIYSWIPPTALSNPNISTPISTPASTISYTVVISDANGCINADSMSVTVNPVPVASAGSDVSICSGFSTSLNASGGITYAWTPAAGLNNPAISNPVASPAATTIYTVTVTDANNCSDTDDITVTIFQTPVASFTATTVCFNNPTVFTDLSTGTISQWDWDFGDGNISNVQNPSHTYNTYGNFIAILIVTSPDGCKDTFGLTITVNPLPAVSFTSTSVCIGNPTCFTDLTTIASGTLTTWSWNFGDPNLPANISNVQNPCVTYTASGTYMVVLTVTSSNNCQSTTILPAVVFAPPVAAFTASNACLNSPTIFTNGSSGSSQWYWQFGDGGTSVLQNPVHTYLGYGNYIVTLISSSSAGCSDTITDTITVYSMPVVNFSSDTVCEGNPTSFSDLSFIPSGNISSWSWNFGDGNSDTAQNPSHMYSSSGNYTVTLTATSNNNCVSSLSLPVLVYQLPKANFNTSPAPTAGLTDEVLFSDLSTGGVVQWFWDLGDSTLDTAQNPVHVYSDTGSYVITLIVVTNNGCMDTIQKPFEVRDFAFYIPNAFTPNGDDRNEFFFGVGLGIVDYEMWIFDRWGNQVFYCHNKGLPQLFPCLWDGKVKGGGSNERVQEDVYVWKVRFFSLFEKEYNYIGHVSVISKH